MKKVDKKIDDFDKKLDKILWALVAATLGLATSMALLAANLAIGS